MHKYFYLNITHVYFLYLFATVYKHRPARKLKFTIVYITMTYSEVIRVRKVDYNDHCINCSRHCAFEVTYRSCSICVDSDCYYEYIYYIDLLCYDCYIDYNIHIGRVFED